MKESPNEILNETPENPWIKPYRNPTETGDDTLDETRNESLKKLKKPSLKCQNVEHTIQMKVEVQLRKYHAREGEHGQM